MKASERLSERNDITAIIQQIDAELDDLSAGEKTIRACGRMRELFAQREEMASELHLLGFSAPQYLKIAL